MNRKSLFLVLSIACFASATAPFKLANAQEQSMPGMQMPAQQQANAHHHVSPSNGTEVPRFGQAEKDTSQKFFALEDAQQLARAKNPTLRQAEAGIRAAKARQLQSGLLPNPTVGYSADEIRGGAE